MDKIIYFAHHELFKYLRHNTHQRNWAVVHYILKITFFRDRNDECCFQGVRKLPAQHRDIEQTCNDALQHTTTTLNEMDGEAIVSYRAFVRQGAYNSRDILSRHRGDKQRLDHLNTSNSASR